MPLFAKIPVTTSFVDASDIFRVEQAFIQACEKAGVDPAAAEAEKIGIMVLADYAISAGSTPPATG